MAMAFTTSAGLCVRDADDWEKLLWSLMAADNGERNRAELAFAELKEQADVTLIGLMQVVHSSKTDDVRGLAAVLLRRVLLRDAVSLWPHASEAVRDTLKLELLDVLRNETNRSIRRKVCDTVGELASSILDDAQWDDLLPTLLQWIEAPNVTLREATLRVFEMVAIYLAGIVVDDTSPEGIQFQQTLFTMLATCLADPDGRVALNAIRALSMLLINMENLYVQRYDLLEQTLPLVLAAMHRMVQQQHFEDVMETLEVLIEVAEPHAMYFKPGLREYVDMMVQIADTAQLPDGCRQLAMEFLVSIAEQSSSACKKLPKNRFVTLVYPVAFRMMLEVQDVDTWSATTCEDEEASGDRFAANEISNFDVGSEALERLVGAIGARKSLPKCFTLIQEYAANQENWLYRHAALVGLCQILDVLSNEHLEAVVRHVLTQAQDQHPRVCCTALDVIGQLAVDQGPQFQDTYHAQAVPILLHYLKDAQMPRLQAHAATSLRQFIDMCQPQVLKPYLEDMLQQAFSVLQSAHGSRIVQEQVITAIASIATVAGPAFRQYYAAVLPSLKQVLLACLHESASATGTPSPGSFTLGGITLECISLIGLAVGKETFANDALEIMKIMAEMQNTPKIVGNEWIRTYLLQAWARCCKCLGKDFASYLPVVMPTLLFAAMQQAEFEVDPATLRGSNGGDDDDDATDTASNCSSDDIQLAQVNDKCLSIRTSILEEKATACQLLAGMVTDLEDAFFPYAEQVTQVLAPLMTDSVHSDIRSSSISSMAALVKCVSLAASSNHEAIKQMLDFTLGRLVHALTSEPELELVMNIMQSMKLVINYALEAVAHDVRVVSLVRLNEAQLREVVQGLLLVLGDSFQRRALRRAEKSVQSAEDAEEDGYENVVDDEQAEEDEQAYDDDDEEEDSVEQELQFILADCVGNLAKTHGESFFPVFHAQLWDKIIELAGPHCLPEDRKLALYILDDVLDYCGAPAMQRLNEFLPLLMEVLQNSEQHPSLVQAAAFGIGVSARNGGAQFAPHASQCLDLLRAVVMHCQARHATRLNATDNAVSAIGLICEFHGAQVDSAMLFPQWLRMLPLRGDLEESMEVTKRLCRYVTERKPEVLGGAECAQVGVIVSVLADVITNSDAYVAQVGETEFASLVEQISGALASLQASTPVPTMAQAWTALTPRQQATLHTLFG